MKARALLLPLVSVLLATVWGHAQNQQSQLVPRGQPPSENTQKVRRKAEQASDRLLVRFRSGTRSDRAAAVHARVGSFVRRTFRTVSGLSVVQLPPGLPVREAIRSYREQPEVVYAEPDYIVRIDQNPVIPNDPSFPSLWGLHNTGQSLRVWPRPLHSGTPDADIDAPEAWTITTGSPNVVIGIIDTGIDYNHGDLTANLFRNSLDCNNNGMDDDGNGYVDDCYGIDTFNNDSNPMDDNGHGTHVAGTIGATGNNSIGIVGVNWTVKLAPCKFMGSDGWGYDSDAIECLDYFASLKDRGVNIVATSNSWGGGGFSRALVDAIDTQRQKGSLFIAAAGNTGGDADVDPQYPAAYDLPNIISVAATDYRDERASFSTYGRESVDLGAPGVNILSTFPSSIESGGYRWASGTSMATPHVTGVVALLKAADSSRNWLQLKNLILTAVTTFLRWRGRHSPANA